MLLRQKRQKILGYSLTTPFKDKVGNSCLFCLSVLFGCLFCVLEAVYIAA